MSPIIILLIILIWLYIPKDSDYSVERQKQQNKNQQRKGIQKKRSQVIREAITEVKKNKKIKHNVPFKIDIMGAMTLSISVIFFLVVVSDFAPHVSSSSSSGSSSKSLLFGLSQSQETYIIIASVSLVLFIIIERKTKNKNRLSSSSSSASSISGTIAPAPLMDFDFLLRNKVFLLSTVVLVIGGFLFYTILHVLPILVRTPTPDGLGQNAEDTGKILLPLVVVTAIIGPFSGFIVSRITAVRSLLIGSVLMSVGFVALSRIYSNELLLSTFLAVLNVGYFFSVLCANNMIILSTPKQVIGTILGTAILLKYIGTAVGPAVAGMYMHTHLSLMTTKNGVSEFFPSSESYFAIFVYSAIVSMAGVGIAAILAKRSPRCQHHTIEERGEIGPLSKRMIEEVSKWPSVTVRSHPFGGIEICVKRRDVGHIHGDRLVDLPLPSRSKRTKQNMPTMTGASYIDDHDISKEKEDEKDTIVRKDMLLLPPSHTYKESGWIGYYPRSIDDVPILIKKLKLQYDTVLCTMRTM